MFIENPFHAAGLMWAWQMCLLYQPTHFLFIDKSHWVSAAVVEQPAWRRDLICDSRLKLHWLSVSCLPHLFAAAAASVYQTTSLPPVTFRRLTSLFSPLSHILQSSPPSDPFNQRSDMPLFWLQLHGLVGTTFPGLIRGEREEVWSQTSHTWLPPVSSSVLLLLINYYSV